MDSNRIKEVISDESFVKRLSQLEDIKEIQAAFEEKDLYFSIDELNAFSEQFVSNDELSYDQLDEVAGGLAVPLIMAYGLVIIGTLKRLFG